MNWKFENAYVFDTPIEFNGGTLHLCDIPELDPDNLPSAHKINL